MLVSQGHGARRMVREKLAEITATAMLFNSVDFIIFFAVFYVAYLLANLRWQNVLLFFAGMVFYGYWDWRFLSLIFFSIASDYFFGIKIFEATEPRRRKLFLMGSITVNLTLLAIFKYYNFFAENLIAAGHVFGLSLDWFTLSVLLPIGISFYTFQSLSYTIDIYRKRMPPERNIFTFAVFVLFFPQLLAGPIERAVALLPQIKRARQITVEDLKLGTWLILWGYYLKVFMADNLAHTANLVYATGAQPNATEVIVGTYAFAFQILGDFAGYSSIAIGLARLLGFRLMTNFLFPYFVTNPQQFWHNWHISLSTWLRDYLYISLGGSKHGTLRTYRNLFLTMFLGGIWHGANWPYVFWGIYQGGILIVHRLIASRTPDSQQVHNGALATTLKIIFMFQVTCLGWLIFRATSAHQISSMFQTLFTASYAITPLAGVTIKQLVFFAMPTMLIQFYNWRRNDQFAILGAAVLPKAALAVGLLYSIAIWGEFNAQHFIYFQF
jgi:alginate O-acetyltransferase complex protein AlgI